VGVRIRKGMERLDGSLEGKQLGVSYVEDVTCDTLA
jgi:hypothetical protein